MRVRLRWSLFFKAALRLWDSGTATRSSMQLLLANAQERLVRRDAISLPFQVNLNRPMILRGMRQFGWELNALHEADRRRTID